MIAATVRPREMMPKNQTPAVHGCRAGGGEVKSRANYFLRRRRSIVAPKALMSALVGSGTAAIVKEPEMLLWKVSFNSPTLVLNFAVAFLYWLVPKDPSVSKLLRVLLITPRESSGGDVLLMFRSINWFLTSELKGFAMLRIPTVLPIVAGTRVAVSVLSPVLMLTIGDPAR